MKRKPLYKVRYAQVIVAIVIGVLVGHFLPADALAMKPLGDPAIKLVRMITSPVIFCTVVFGIASMHDMSKVRRVGGKALLYFEAVSTLTLAIGLLAAHVLKPGAGFIECRPIRYGQPAWILLAPGFRRRQQLFDQFPQFIINDRRFHPMDSVVQAFKV